MKELAAISLKMEKILEGQEKIIEFVAKEAPKPIAEEAPKPIAEVLSLSLSLSRILSPSSSPPPLLRLSPLSPSFHFYFCQPRGDTQDGD